MITLIKDVTTLSDNDLLSYTVKLAQHENKIGLQIIACLREAERRMLYTQMGMSSLWSFATQYLGLSEGNAQLKISAMRLGRDNRIAQEKIESGELSITNAAKVSSFFRQEKKAGHTYTPKQKAEVTTSIAATAAAVPVPESKPGFKPETKTESKIAPNLHTGSVPTPRKYILVEDSRSVMRRAQGQCEYFTPDGRRCTSRWQLHLDHVIPLALGGQNEKSNYRVVCARHNLYHAHLTLGPVMKDYVPSLK